MSATIETVRNGVEFTPEAAAAFRRAEAQVLREFGRLIRVNSTFRPWATQLAMHLAWLRYVASGYKSSLYPGHSKAVHPSESFHVSGLALDSSDWAIARIVAILAENGFIRNRLSVPNEQHHFEYIRSRDRNYGKPSGSAQTPTSVIPNLQEDDMIAARIKDHSGVNHHAIIGQGHFRHLLGEDDPEWMKNVVTADDRWTDIPLDRLPSVLRTYGCDLHIWDIRGGTMVVRDPLDGSVRAGNLWSATNAARSTIGAVQVTSAETAKYVKKLSA